ncbi:hypothetical protein EJB05_07122, partial [Eragrostis curvula]
MKQVNWELQGCCDHDQRIFLVAIGVSTVVILLVSPPFPAAALFFALCWIDCPGGGSGSSGLCVFLQLWRTFLLTPFKLITVFLHETSHALACKLTCGDVNLFALSHVEGMQVHANEGGSTQTRGGIYWIILPAGYLGSSFWGMVFILASTNLLTTRIAAGCFLLALVVVLFVAKNWFLRWLCIGFIVFIAVAWVIQELTSFHCLKYVILFIGVMNSLFSVYDIYDDLISRRVNSSDAEKFAEICPCPCNGCAWGVIWSGFHLIYLSLHIDISWTGYIVLRDMELARTALI